MSKSKTPLEVFKAIKDHRQLEYIAEHRKLDISEKSTRKQLPKILAKDVSATGLHKMLSVFTKKVLDSLSEELDWDEGEDQEKTRSKPVIVKKLYNTMDRIGSKKFLEKCSSSALNEMCKQLEIKVKSDDDKATKISYILKEADDIGLDNCFTSFPIASLQSFCDSCDLDVDSLSVNILVDCLMNLEDYEKPPKKKKKKEKISESKPSLKKGITSSDLYYWYKRETLVEFLDKKKLMKTGNKTELVKRILNHFDGKDELPKSKQPKRGKKRKAANQGKKKNTKKAKKSNESEDQSESESGKDSKRSKSKKEDSSESSDMNTDDSSVEEKKEKDKKRDSKKGKETKEKEKEKGKDVKSEKEKVEKDKGKDKDVKADKGKEKDVKEVKDKEIKIKEKETKSEGGKADNKGKDVKEVKEKEIKIKETTKIKE